MTTLELILLLIFFVGVGLLWFAAWGDTLRKPLLGLAIMLMVVGGLGLRGVYSEDVLPSLLFLGGGGFMWLAIRCMKMKLGSRYEKLVVPLMIVGVLLLLVSSSWFKVNRSERKQTQKLLANQ